MTTPIHSSRLFIDIHILQSVPPSNINRDDTGSPKTARFGGVPRSRVSSQAWKHATRHEFERLLDRSAIGQRTKYAVDMIASRITELNPQLSDKAAELAKAALTATGIKVTEPKKESDKPVTGYLLFISSIQASKLASLAVASEQNGEDIDKKVAREVMAHDNAVDIALFGRMVADAPDINVDASVQVAHAIGIHRAETEFDYFTAVDDRASEDNSGAGMIGTVEFTSSTLYRYATVNVPLLEENLGSIEATVTATRAFLEAFIVSMPTGKQNTFANRTLPSAVVVQLRQTQPVSLVNAFERPVEVAAGEDRIASACDRLVAQEKDIDDAFGVAPIAAYIIQAGSGTEALAALGEQVTLAELLTKVGEQVHKMLPAQEQQ